MDDADVFFRDCNTLRKMKKRILSNKGYDNFFFNDEIKKEVNDVLKRHLGNKAELF